MQNTYTFRNGLKICALSAIRVYLVTLAFLLALVTAIVVWCEVARWQSDRIAAGIEAPVMPMEDGR